MKITIPIAHGIHPVLHRHIIFALIRSRILSWYPVDSIDIWTHIPISRTSQSWLVEFTHMMTPSPGGPGRKDSTEVQCDIKWPGAESGFLLGSMTLVLRSRLSWAKHGILGDLRRFAFQQTSIAMENAQFMVDLPILTGFKNSDFPWLC